MKTFRDRFEENYIAIPKKTKKGKTKVEYVYYGPWYFWDIPEDKLRKVKIRSAVLCGFSAVVFLLCSLLRTGVNTSLLVEVPSLLSICALIYEIIGTIQFVLAPYRTTRTKYEDVNNMLCIAPVFRAILLLIAATMCAWELLLVAYDPLGIAVMCGYLLSAVFSIILRKEYMVLPMRTEKNTTVDDIEKKAEEADARKEEP